MLATTTRHELEGESPVLVLSRRAGESINIGDDVIVTVLEVRGDVVRVGINAPRSIRVHREEVYRELQEANRAAARTEGEQEAAVAALTSLFPKADPGSSPDGGTGTDSSTPPPA